jgi:hypothetical protein
MVDLENNPSHASVNVDFGLHGPRFERIEVALCQIPVIIITGKPRFEI